MINGKVYIIKIEPKINLCFYCTDQTIINQQNNMPEHSNPTSASNSASNIYNNIKCNNKNERPVERRLPVPPSINPPTPPLRYI